MKKNVVLAIALFMFTNCDGDEPEKPNEDAGDISHAELGADLESDSEDGSTDTAITDLETDGVEIEDAQVETDVSSECGTSSVTLGIAPTPIILDNNQVLNSTLGSADYVWFWDDYTVRSYVPKAALSITQAVVVDSDGDIYVSASYSTYRIVVGSTEPEHFANIGGFYMTIDDDGIIYTDFVECGENGIYYNCLFTIDTETGDTEPFAWNLGDYVGGRPNLAGPLDGYIYYDAFVEVEGHAQTRLIRIPYPPTQTPAEWEFVDWGRTGPKTVDDDGNLYVLSYDNTIYRLEDDRFEPVVCFESFSDEVIIFGGLAVNDEGDFFMTEERRVGNDSDEPHAAVDGMGNRVFRVDRETGEIENYVSGLTTPNCIVTDNDGESFVVTEYDTGSLKRINAEGEIETIVLGNMFNGAGGLVYVNDSFYLSGGEATMLVRTTQLDDDQVEIAPYMAPYNTFAGVASEFAYFSLETDGTDLIYMAEYAIDIERAGVSITNTSTDEVSWLYQVTEPGTDYRNPNGLAIDDDGDIWVSNCVSGHIEEYAPDGTLKQVTTDEQKLTIPADLVWHDGYLYIAEYGTNQIVRMDPTDLSSEVWAGPFDAPMFDLVFAPNGNLITTSGGTLHIIDPADRDTLHTLGGTVGGNGFFAMVFRDDVLFITVGPNMVIEVSGPFTIP